MASRLSLAMIVKNEEKHLAHCLESVQGLVDEIVILDTGSTDGTATLARAFGARLESFTWVDDFSAARNAALALCSGDWILVLDADEAIDGADHACIRAALEAPGIHGYHLWLRNHLRSGSLVGAASVQANDGKYREGAAYGHHISRRGLRLFRRQEGPVFQGRVHELADDYFLSRGLKLADLDAVIHHYGKLDAEQDLAKQSGYLQLARAEAEARPQDAVAHYNVLQEALMVQDWALAQEAARHYLGLTEKAPLLVHLGAAKAALGLGKAQEALVRLEPILAQEPDQPAALCAKGECLEALGRTQEAQATYLRALEIHPEFSLSFLQLSACLERAGDRGTARRVLEAGLDQNPKDLSLWTALVSLSAKDKEKERAAADAWDALQAVPDGGKGIWHQIVIHALLAQGAREDARLVLERGLRAFPGHHELLALGQRI